MKIKLVIDGGDERVRIEPVTASDKKLLEYIAEWDIAEVKVSRGDYSGQEIKRIDLVLEMKAHEDGSIGVAEIPSL